MDLSALLLKVIRKEEERDFYVWYKNVTNILFFSFFIGTDLSALFLKVILKEMILMSSPGY
jgi:hypothetical protein